MIFTDRMREFLQLKNYHGARCQWHGRNRLLASGSSWTAGGPLLLAATARRLLGVKPGRSGAMEEKATTKYRPSSLGRIALCSGSASMSAGLSLPESDEAREGTLLHKAIATGNLDDLDEDQIETVEKCRKFLKEILS